MYLRKYLDWLWGYPLKTSDQWQSLYFLGAWQESKQTINGLTLSTTLYHRNKLITDYPQRLSSLVGDIKIWSQQIELKIKAIKNVLKGETVDPWVQLIYPQLKRRDLNQIQKSQKKLLNLAPICDQFAWWFSHDLEILKKAIHWLVENQESLVTIQQQQSNSNNLIAKLFVVYYKTAGKNNHALFHILQNPQWKNARPYYFSYEQIVKGGIKMNREPLNLTNQIIEWLDYCLTLSIKTLNQQLTVLNLLFNKRTIEDLAKRWQLQDTLVGMNENFKLQKEREKIWKKPLISVEQFNQQLKPKLKEIQYIKVPVFEAKTLINMLNWLAENPAIFNQLIKFIKILAVNKHPSDSIWRTPYFNLFLAFNWYTHYHKLTGSYKKRLISFLSLITNFIKTPNIENQLKRLTLLTSIFKFSEEQSYFINKIFYKSEGLPELAKFCDLIEEPIDEIKALDILNDYNDIDQKILPWQDYILYQQTLIKAEINTDNLYIKTWQNFHKISAGNSDNLLVCVKRWEEPNILPIATLFQSVGFIDIANYFADKQEWAALRPFKYFIKAFNELKLNIPIPQTPPKKDSSWIKDYPIELESMLLLLNKRCFNAESMAENHLRRYFPSQQHIKQEIAILTEKIKEKESEILQKRCTNLNNRLLTPVTISPERFKNFNHKIRHLAYSGFTKQWLTLIKNDLKQRLSNAFDLTELPDDSLGNPRHLLALIAFLTLSKSTQKVVKKILQARLQDKPWDLRTEPANALFIKEMQKKNINMTPWLEGIGTIVNTIKDQKIAIELEQDPLEIFHMGSHFETCLSIFDFNYFSVVANVADINKRIVYLKNENQQIMGRCLFALNTQGHLLNFFSYSHQGEKFIKSAVDEFADDLAQQMGTVRASKGPVKTLVADEWYDDGAELFTNASPDFIKDSLFKKQLLTLPLYQTEKLINELFSQPILTPIIIQYLLNLDEFQQRPELCLCLVKRIQALKGIDREVRLKIMQYLIDCNEKKQALNFAKNFKLAYYRYVEDGLVYKEVKLLIKISPALAYRAVIKTRDKEIKTDQTDSDSYRLFFLGQIYERLYRPKKALNCYQIALTRKSIGDNDKKEIAQKIKLLDGDAIKHDIRNISPPKIL